MIRGDIIMGINNIVKEDKDDKIPDKNLPIYNNNNLTEYNKNYNKTINSNLLEEDKITIKNSEILINNKNTIIFDGKIFKNYKRLNRYKR